MTSAKSFDVCHVVGCEALAADMAWCPEAQVCLQVCEAHAFDTLPEETCMDMDRAAEDHAQNLALYHGSVKQ